MGEDPESSRSRRAGLARQSAAGIGTATGFAVRESALLRERDCGELRGLPDDMLGFDPIEDERAPPGGESMAGLRARVAEAHDGLRALRREADDGRGVAWV
ncbi:MAG: histidine phosphatase family protein [Burkholderiales bacterium]|nr:histidine phosphatase family protein [Burkholderiales bacterium]